MYTCTFLICSIVLLFFHLYKNFKELRSYFHHHGVPFVKSQPLFGNVLDWILLKKPLPMIYYDVYKQLEPHRFGGLYFGWQKQILIRDPELIHNILVKDFSHFQNRNVVLTSSSDMMNKQIFFSRDTEWKNLRSKLTNAFTSDKLKIMFPLVRDQGTKLHQALKNLANKEDIRVKEICVAYATDVIGACLLGLEINSIGNINNSLLVQMGKRILEMNFFDILVRLLPKLHFFFTLFQDRKTALDYFFKLIKETVKHRQDHNIVRNDFLDLLIQLKRDTDLRNCDDHQSREDLQQNTKTHIEMTDEVMTAQCIAFFTGGFETSSSTLNFMLMELAQNHHVQDKLRNEIITVLENNNNELTYEAMKQMKYMDMVIDETLRKYPITGSLSRRCSKPYHIPDSNYIMPQGTNIVISIRGIHYDSKYYEKPFDFYPEHFTEQAKAQRPNNTFLPFGEGPRICIGLLFAKMQIKVAAVNFLKDFSYHMSPKTNFTGEFTPGTGLFDFKGGIWLRCNRLR